MKIILIDDERLALEYLEHQLRQNADIEVIGKFLDPVIGKESILGQEVDVVFLDIDLPEISGIELAEQLLESKPNLNIVFVTAYNEYAVKAFELNALDYVVKPVSAERLKKTLQRIQSQMGQNANEALIPSQAIRMNVFQQLLIESAPGELTAMHWRTSKARELFLYLLQRRGQLVRKSMLIELLWPEYEISKVYAQLYTCVYHVRKTLEPYGERFQIANLAEGYIMQISGVLLDAEEWENKLKSAPPLSRDSIQHYSELMKLYSGDYLEEYDYVWAESERHRLKTLWLRTTYQMAEWYASDGQTEKAMEWYHEIIARQPHAEGAHFALMKIYASLDQSVLVHQQYRKLADVFREEFGEQPGAAVMEWYAEWKQEHKE